MFLYRLLFKDRSLWFKFSLMTVLPLLLAAALLVLNIVGAVEKSMMDKAQQAVRHMTDITSLSMSSANVIYNKDLLDNFVTSLEGEKDIVLVAVVDASDGRILSHSHRERDGRLHDPALFKNAARLETQSKRADAVEVYLSPLVIQGNKYGDLIVAYTSERVIQEVASFRAKVVTATGLSVVVGLILAVGLARFLSSPVRLMSDQARKIGAGDYEQRVVYSSRDALGELADSFNEMMANLRDRRMQLETINNIAAQLHQSLHREEILKMAVKILGDYTGAPSVSIYLLDPAAGLLRLVDQHGFLDGTLKAGATLPLEGSLSGLAVKEREIIVSEDLAADHRVEPRVRKHLLEDGFRAVVSIPLLYHDEALGVVNLIFHDTTPIRADQRATFLSVGRTLALALSNAEYVSRIEDEIEERTRVEEALRHSIQEMTALNNLAHKTGRHLTFKDVVRAALESLVEPINPDMIVIFLLEDDRLVTQEFHAPHLSLSQADLAEHVVGQCLCGHSVQVGQSIYVADMENDPRCRRDECRKAGLSSFAALPLIVGDGVIGVLGLGTRERRDFGQEARFLETLVGQLSVALMNARHYEQIRNQAAELEIRVAERTSELAVAMEKAREADRIKSAFLASMSHELRTPLNSIIGFTGILLQELPGPLNPEQKKQMEMVKNSARHLLDLINDVLDISKIEAGQLALSYERFDYRKLVDKVVRSVGPLAEKKGLRFDLNLEEGLAEIRSDRRRMEQILINLINNAIKFTDQGRVSVAARLADARVVTTVRDTGIGMKSEEMETLFKEFRQLDSGLARRFEGTGLGLSICKKLVEMMGGNILAESDGPGLGSAFTFTLPVEGGN
ncbi:MAG: GAF domain-containing protein [Thermodesulfobacteriota bacterium]